MSARYTFTARYSGSSLTATVTAPNAPVAFAHGVARAHDVFGCDESTRRALNGQRFASTLTPLDGGSTIVGRYRFHFDE